MRHVDLHWRQASRSPDWTDYHQKRAGKQRQFRLWSLNSAARCHIVHMSGLQLSFACENKNKTRLDKEQETPSELIDWMCTHQSACGLGSATSPTYDSPFLWSPIRSVSRNGVRKRKNKQAPNWIKKQKISLKTTTCNKTKQLTHFPSCL